MPLPRPRKYENQAARQRAYEQRQKDQISREHTLAQLAIAIANVASERGFIPLMSPDPISHVKEALKFIASIEASNCDFEDMKIQA